MGYKIVCTNLSRDYLLHGVKLLFILIFHLQVCWLVQFEYHLLVSIHIRILLFILFTIYLIYVCGYFISGTHWNGICGETSRIFYLVKGCFCCSSFHLWWLHSMILFGRNFLVMMVQRPNQVEDLVKGLGSYLIWFELVFLIISHDDVTLLLILVYQRLWNMYVNFGRFNYIPL